MNSYNYSYNVLINRLEAFAAGHFLIKRFTHGQIDLADMDQDEQYPFMHVVPNNITPVDGGMQFDFQIIFADIPRDKELKAEYQREVISDCVRLAQDLIAEVKNGLQLFGFDVQLVTNPTIEPFMEEYKNTLTGVTFSLQLEVPWDWSACDIPAIWSVGGASGSGGSGTGYGIVLRTNGVDNAVQNILDLVEGTNVTITDNGNGSVTIDAAGGGGGEYVSTEYNVNHITALGNPYQIGDRVWYNGSVYRCIANNDAINPSNPTYWTLVAVGYRLRQSPVDWNASSGDYQIINKPTLATVATTGDYNDLDNLPTIPAAQVNSDWNAVSGVAEILNKPTIPVNLDDLADVNAPTPSNGQVLTYNTTTSDWEAATPSAGGSGTVTSVGLTMPSAFSVIGSPITTAGTLAITGAGLATQYVRGDGQLANFPTTSGGGSSVSYYLNGSINQGTIGGSTYYQMSKTAVFGAGTDFTRTNAQGNGLIAQFITDVNDPNVLLVPGGNFNLELYFSASSSGATPSFYVELYKYDGTTFTLLATDVATPEGITQGTVIDAYFTALAVPATTMALTDRLALRVFVTTSGRTLKLHTEDSHLSQVITTLSTGVNAINGLTSQVQNLATGTAGSDFAISSAGSTHTFNLPTASAANRGALSSADWSTFNSKVSTSRAINTSTPLQGGGDLSADRTLSIVDAAADGTTKGAATFTAADFNSSSGVISLDYANGQKASASQPGFLSATDFSLLKRDTFTIRPFIGTASVADNTNYFFGEQTLGLSTSAVLYDMKLPYDAVLIGATIYAGNLTTNASNELSTLNFRLNNTTDTLLSNQISFGGAPAISNIYTVTGLSVAVSASDTFVMKWTTPAWATNPTAAQIIVSLFFERA
jgi:hypothetical protein